MYAKPASPGAKNAESKNIADIMKKNDTLVNDTLKELDEYAKLIKESYVFNDGEEPMEDEEMVDNEYTEETCHSTEKINQIRMLALDGIQEYADDVDSEEYDFFKKIWLMCDKVCSEKDNAKIDNE